MLHILRKHQHGIMIVVAFIVIVAFAWFFNPYDTRRGSLNQAIAFRIGSKGVTIKEVERQTRVLQAASDLGFNFTMQLLQPTFDVVDFTQNRYILGEEARKLGVDPSEKEVQAAIAEHPQFQRDQKFSEDAYLDAIKETLEPAGLVAGDLRELMADKLRLDKVTALLSSGFDVPQSVVDVEFQRERELISASVVDFKLADFEEGIELTDEELKAYYEEQKGLVPTEERELEGRLEEAEQAARDLIKSAERRKVEFVFFPEPVAPAAPVPPVPPTVPNLTPPRLLQPGTNNPPIPNPGGALSAPPLDPLDLEPIEVPAPETETGLPSADDESEPPGQEPAPLEEGAGKIDAEPLDAPPIEIEDIDLTPAEDLAGEVNVGGLGEDPAAPGGGLNLGDGAAAALPELAVPDLEVPPIDAPDGGEDEEDHTSKLRAYETQVDKFYMAVLAEAEQFTTLAEADGLEIQTTELFSQDDPPASPVVPSNLITTIFKASMETDNGILVPVEGISPKGYYIARLLEIDESAVYTFEEVKEDLRKALVKKKATEKMEEAANEARTKLLAAMEGGKSFADAVAELNLTSRDVPEFSMNKRPTGTDNVTEILAAVPTTTTGSISEMTRAGDDALLVHVSQRVAAAETKEEVEDPAVPAAGPGATTDPAEEKKRMAERLEMQAGSGMINLWIADRRENANIVRDHELVQPRIYFPRSLGGGFGF